MENQKKVWTIKEAFAHGWHKTKANFWFIVALLLVVYAVSYAGQESAIGFIISVFTGFIMASVFLRISRGQTVTFNNLFTDLSGGKFVQYFVMMVVTTVFVVIGLVFLIVPGVIIGLMMSFSAFAMMDEPKEVSWKSNAFWRAMKQSKHLANGEKWNLLAFFLVALGLNVLGALAFGLGLIITIPVSVMALAYIYDALKNKPAVVIAEIPGNAEEVHASETPETNINQ